MKFRVVTEFDPVTRSFAAYCPELPGCCSAGETEKEALENAREAIKLYLEPFPLDIGSGKKIHDVDVKT